MPLFGPGPRTLDSTPEKTKPRPARELAPLSKCLGDAVDEFNRWAAGQGYAIRLREVGGAQVLEFYDSETGRIMND